MNTGKRFEQQIKDSIPKDVFYYRLRDGTAGWNQNDNSQVRFQVDNICDCFLFAENKLILLELKSVGEKSFPFSKLRESQIKGLTDARRYKGVTAGVLINFNKLERTFFVDIEVITNYIAYMPKKSINYKELERLGIEIPGKKKRVNFRWNLTMLWDGRDSNV